MFLEHQAGVPVLGIDPADAVVDDVVADADAAPVDVGEAGHEAQQRRLPATARTDDGQQLVAGDRQVEVVDGREAAERLADGAQLQDVVGHR